MPIAEGHGFPNGNAETVQILLNASHLAAVLFDEVNAATMPAGEEAMGAKLMEHLFLFGGNVIHRLIDRLAAVFAEVGDGGGDIRLGCTESVGDAVDVDPVLLLQHQRHFLLAEVADDGGHSVCRNGGVGKGLFVFVETELTVHGHIAVKGDIADGKHLHLGDVPSCCKDAADAFLLKCCQCLAGAFGNGVLLVGDQRTVRVKKDGFDQGSSSFRGDASAADGLPP